MKNITRFTLATAAMLTLIVSSAPAAGYIKFGGIDGESSVSGFIKLDGIPGPAKEELEMMIQFERQMLLEEEEETDQPKATNMRRLVWDDEVG